LPRLGPLVRPLTPARWVGAKLPLLGLAAAYGPTRATMGHVKGRLPPNT